MEQVNSFHATPQPRRSGLAIASLVLGIIGLLSIVMLIATVVVPAPAPMAGIIEMLSIVVLIGFPLVAILAIILGDAALSKIRESAGAVAGSGMAIAGLITGCVALVILLLLIFYPAVNHHGPGPMTSALSKGRSIYMAVYGEQLSDVATNDHGSRWPKSGEFSSSTAYFTNLVDRRVLNVNYSFFAAPGITPCKSTNAAQFKAENNAWCVVADLKDTDPDNTPFLFTRNLRIASLAEFRGGDQVDDVPPFGRRGVVVVFKSAAAIVLRPEALASNFPAMGTATNRVLRP